MIRSLWRVPAWMGALPGILVTPALLHAAALGTTGVAVPLYALSDTCTDRRFPQLAGAWAIGCTSKGQLDLAIYLPDGRTVPLDPPLDPRHTAVSRGLAADEAVLVEVHGSTRIIDLSPAGAFERSGGTRLPAVPTAPPATTATHFAAVLDGRVEALGHEARVRPSFPARPVGWYPPAIAWPHVAWVERAADHTEQVWTVQVDPPGEPRMLSSGPGHHRHVVSDGERFIWVADGHLEWWDPQAGHRGSTSARTGFHAPPSASGGEVCWEERAADFGAGDEARHIDIRCSDGLAADGPGDQLFPSRSGPYLLYRSGGRNWLKTAP